MQIVYLASVSCVAWFISLLAGGGSPFILIPLVNVMLGVAEVPPVLTIGMGLGNAHRMFLFWREIDWTLTLWYTPGAIAGAVLGAYTFTQLHLAWLQLLIGLFLIISMVSLWFSPQESTITIKAWYILPAAFVKAFVSGLIGTTGPILNVFYLSYGLVKEELIATKAVHMVIVHVIKLITYGFFGALSHLSFSAGLTIGLAAIPANFIGQYILKKMNAKQFRQLVLVSMAISGLWMFWGQISLLNF